MKIYIRERERYPDYCILDKEEDFVPCYCIEVNQEQVDKWNKIELAYAEAQNEIKVLYNKLYMGGNKNEETKK